MWKTSVALCCWASVETHTHEQSVTDPVVVAMENVVVNYFDTL